MNFLFANTTNHRRIVMFLTSGFFDILFHLVFLKWPIASITIWEFINAAIIGLLTFEFFHRTRRFLNLKTLVLYTILVVVVSRWLYFIFGRVESTAISNRDLFFNPLENILSSVRFVPSLFFTLLAYFLIMIYRNKSLKLEDETLTTRVAVKTGLIIGLIPMVLVFISASLSLDIFYGFVFVFILGTPVGILGGMLGAVAGKNWTNTWNATLIGSILGTISSIVLWFLLIGNKLGIPQ